MFKVEGKKFDYSYIHEAKQAHEARNLARRLEGAKVTLTEEGRESLEAEFGSLLRRRERWLAKGQTEKVAFVDQEIQEVKDLFKEFVDPKHESFASLLPDQNGFFWEVEVIFDQEKGYHDVYLSGACGEMRENLRIDFVEFCNMFEGQDLLFAPLVKV